MPRPDGIRMTTYLAPDQKHDARVWLEIFTTRKRPHGWSCPCGARGKNFATGEAAMAAAKRHNGGWYNGEEEA